MSRSLHKKKGYGVQRDKILAVKHYKLAADKNYALAQYNFGVMVRNGQGVDEDQELALKYFQLAASTGAPWAQFNLAGIYEFGTCGAKPSMSLAIHYLCLAANQGDCRAQYRLAKLYESGGATAPNFALALHCWHLAFAQRHEAHHRIVCRQLRKVYLGERGEEFKVVANVFLAKGWPGVHGMVNKECQKAILEMYWLRREGVGELPLEVMDLVVRAIIKWWPASHFVHLVVEENVSGDEELWKK